MVEYDDLTSKQKAIVDEIVDRDPRSLNELNKADVARKAGSGSSSYVSYVIDNFNDLIVDRMERSNHPVVTDGQGRVVNFKMNEEQAFKAIRILPSNLSKVLYNQMRGYPYEEPDEFEPNDD